MATNENRTLQYVPFTSCVHPGFWNSLTKLKLETLGLEEKPVDASAKFYNNDSTGLPSRLSVEWDSIPTSSLKMSDKKNSDSSKTNIMPWNTFKSNGQITILNTIDAFKSLDKKKFLSKESSIIWEAINDGRAIQSPDKYLNRFTILIFADLKKYHFYYWFAYPAFSLPSELQHAPVVDDAWMIRLDNVCSTSTCHMLSEEYQKWKNMPENQDSSAFFCLKFHPLLNISSKSENDSNQTASIISLEDGITDRDSIVAFADPCTLENHPGWPIRNLLLLLMKYNPDRLHDGMLLLSFRQQIVVGKGDSPNRITAANSFLLRVKYLPEDKEKSTITSPSKYTIESIFNDFPSEKLVGWEKNEKGTGYGPRMVNMRSSMDPSHLAASSVDLNLKLMKWRLLPDIDLQKIKNIRCLLLGSGTLGCNVARCLLGWGVRHITFVDNGKVSYSNPVRQSLFTFEDCLNGGRDKATAASEAMKKIFPAVTTSAFTLTVPMPAHPISSSTETNVKMQYDKLEELINDHDVIYLLMDTRESRWLPTVIAAQNGKLVINSALGFDSYLVMRHGIPKQRQKSDCNSDLENSIMVSGEELGCYFCNDVVAPGNSTTDRTLDQQCTVTRPGVSYIAASLAVELMVSTLQHPKQSLAPAPIIQNIQSINDEKLKSEAESMLGAIVPHSIRGSLHTLSQFLPTTRAFNHCTACSPKILHCYEEKGFEFIKEVANTDGSAYLEKIAGLENLMSEVNMDDIDADFDIESDDGT